MLFAITFVLCHRLRVVPAANKQLQRTVTRRRGDGASAAFHYVLAPRFTRQRAAAQCGVMRHRNGVICSRVMASARYSGRSQCRKGGAI